MNNKKSIITFSPNEKLEAWGYGEWVEERDNKMWEYRGIQCEIYRNRSGVLCGYVQVPIDHCWYGKHYNAIEAEVHGGLTFAETFDGGVFIIGFDCAHLYDLVPSLIDPMRSWRNHIDQLTDKMKETLNTYDKLTKKCMNLLENNPLIFRKTYKNISYVKAQCEKLVDQMFLEKTI